MNKEQQKKKKEKKRIPSKTAFVMLGEGDRKCYRRLTKDSSESAEDQGSRKNTETERREGKKNQEKRKCQYLHARGQMQGKDTRG